MVFLCHHLTRLSIHAASGFCKRLVMKVFLFIVFCSYHFYVVIFVGFLYKTPYVFSPFLGLNNLLMAYEDKSAYALCAYSFALGPDAEPITFLGKTLVHFQNLQECNKYSYPESLFF